MKNIIIAVDNLDLGGIQRLAMDEAYFFDSRRHNVMVISLSPTRETLSILDADRSYFSRHPIRLFVPPEREIPRLYALLKIIRSFQPDLVLSHSPRLVSYFWMLRKISNICYFQICDFIHQLPQLSTRLQNLKSFTPSIGR